MKIKRAWMLWILLKGLRVCNWWIFCHLLSPQHFSLYVGAPQSGMNLLNLQGTLICTIILIYCPAHLLMVHFVQLFLGKSQLVPSFWKPDLCGEMFDSHIFYLQWPGATGSSSSKLGSHCGRCCANLLAKSQWITKLPVKPEGWCICIWSQLPTMKTGLTHPESINTKRGYLPSNHLGCLPKNWISFQCTHVITPVAVSSVWHRTDPDPPKQLLLKRGEGT